MKPWRAYMELFFTAGIIVALDQWTKVLVRTRLPFGGTWVPWDWMTPYARIIHWYNTGAAFGLFQRGNVVFTVLAFFVIAAILYYYPRLPAGDWTLHLALDLQMGGAIGNLIDRLTSGQVTDFISVGTFPVFNIADGCISTGVGVLLLGAWLNERAEKKLVAVGSKGVPQVESGSDNGEIRSG